MNLRDRVLIIVLIFTLSIVGTIFVYSWDSDTQTFAFIPWQDILAYFLIGTPLFIILLILFWLSMGGKAKAYYLTTVISGLTITTVIWLYRFQNGTLEEKLWNFSMIFVMIELMLIVPVQVVRLVVTLLRKYK